MIIYVSHCTTHMLTSRFIYMYICHSSHTHIYICISTKILLSFFYNNHLSFSQIHSHKQKCINIPTKKTKLIRLLFINYTITTLNHNNNNHNNNKQINIRTNIRTNKTQTQDIYIQYFKSS